MEKQGVGGERGKVEKDVGGQARRLIILLAAEQSGRAAAHQGAQVGHRVLVCSINGCGLSCRIHTEKDDVISLPSSVEVKVRLKPHLFHVAMLRCFACRVSLVTTSAIMPWTCSGSSPPMPTTCPRVPAVLSKSSGTRWLSSDPSSWIPS